MPPTMPCARRELAALQRLPRAGTGNDRRLLQEIVALTLARDLRDLRDLRLAQRSAACSAQLPRVARPSPVLP